MNPTKHLLHPHNCFCHIPIEKLEKWFTKHYVEGVSTLELMDSTADASEKEAICVVAMFELDKKSMLQMMGNVNLPQHHILHCREHFKNKLESRLKSRT